MQLLIGIVLLWLTTLLSPLPVCTLSVTIILAFVGLMKEVVAPRTLWLINRSGGCACRRR